MGLRAIVVAGVSWASLGAHAQTADQLQAEGEQAARAGSYAEAIDRFKAADRVDPRASHACLISLAYTRRNLWPQAEIFRDKCHALSQQNHEPLPDWSDTADQQIATAIAKAVASGEVAEVTIRVEPAEANVQLTVSSFAPDESFAPRSIHLPTGTHQIFASAPGYEPTSRLVEIHDGTPRQIVVRLERPPTPPSKLPWIIAGTGLGIAAIGGVLDATWYSAARDRFQNNLADKNLERQWETDRDVVIGLYVAGGAALVTGVILKYTVFKARDRAPQVGFAPRAGGGIVFVGWSR